MREQAREFPEREGLPQHRRRHLHDPAAMLPSEREHEVLPLQDLRGELPRREILGIPAKFPDEAGNLRIDRITDEGPGAGALDDELPRETLVQPGLQ